MPRFRIGEQVRFSPWYTRHNYYGIIHKFAGRSEIAIARYNNHFALVDPELVERCYIQKLTPIQLSKLNQDIKIIWAGRLQYRQPFFRLGRYKRTEWRKGFERYKKVCKEYGISIR